MRAIGKYIRVYPLVKEKLIRCNFKQHALDVRHWHSYLSGSVEDFIESTCCAKFAHPHLGVGIGLLSKIPKLLNQCCVMNECADCGVEKKMMVSTCETLSSDRNEISVMEWILAERQGANKSTGENNTQLELGVSTLLVSECVNKLVSQLDICRIH